MTQEKRSPGFLTRSDTNSYAQLKKKVRSLEILDFRGLVLSVCENKGSDQRCSYCTADLYLFSSPEPKAHKVSL